MPYKFQLHEENISSLKTGDILLGSTFPSLFLLNKDFYGFLNTFAEKYIARFKISHVCLVVVRNNHHLLLEASINPHRDIETGIVSGCKLVDMNERIEAYPGELRARHLILTGGGERRLEIERNIEKVISKYRGRPFKKSMLEMFKAYYCGEHYCKPGIANTTNESSLFCSELIAAVYQHLGLLKFPPDGPHSNEYIPPYFSSSDPIGKKLNLANACLSDEILIKTRKSAMPSRQLLFKEKL
ncbi:hypothetical protein [Sedimenticola sp.]|uniref:hypothetical protein n=1 Tax=Sedimenticola sp. TaxID=1940285 RepID=UPI003D0D2C38